MCVRPLYAKRTSGTLNLASISAVIAALGMSGTVHAQGVELKRAQVAERRVAEINWERAIQDAKIVKLTPDIGLFQKDFAKELSSTQLPVLLPSNITQSNDARIRSQSSAYTIVLRLPQAKLSITGSSVFLTRADDQVFGQGASQQNDRVFENSEDSSDLSFERYGAFYVLRISCVASDDDRCKRDVFLSGVADQLVVVGGAK